MLLVLLAVLVVLLALGGCGSNDGKAPAPPKLGVDVKQYREDEVAGVLQVTFTNHEAQPEHVESVQLLAPDFSSAPAAAPDLDLAPGQRTDVPMAYGSPICHGQVPTSAQPAAVRVRAVRADGHVSDVRLALPVPNETLDRLLNGTCRRAALTKLLQVRFSGLHEETGGSTQRLTVELTYTGADADGLSLTSISGSVIFALTPVVPAGRTPAKVTAEAPKAVFDVRIRTGRCDPHAFAESKKTYQWTLFLALPGGVSSYLVAQPDSATKTTLDGWARRQCGLG